MRRIRKWGTGLLISICGVLVPATTMAQTSSTGIIGDANGDATINALDAQLILAHTVGLPVPPEFKVPNADVNGDGRVGAIDAQIVLSYIVQLNVSQFRIGDDVNSEPIRVDAISPASLRAGAEATITGANFSTQLSIDTVIIDGIRAEILSATETRMTIRVPHTLPCVPEHHGTVKVRVGGAGATRNHPIGPALQLSLETEQTVYLGGEEDLSCVELKGGTAYMMAVYNTTRSPQLPIEFKMTGAGTAGYTPLPTTQHIPPPVMSRAPLRLAPQTHPPRGFSRNSLRNALGENAPATKLHAALRTHQLAHRRMMQQEQQLMQTLQARGAKPLRDRAVRSRVVAPNMGGAGRASLQPSYAISTMVGAYSSVKMHDPGSYNTYSTIRTRTVYAGSKCIVLEDSASALATQIDAQYRQIGTECDNTVMPIIEQYFGNPLVMDQYTDNNGKVILLFTPAVNTKYPGVTGFVTSCDFFDANACPSSNQAEIFYAAAPTKLGDDYSQGTVSNWRWNIRSVVAHEIKHITSFAERLSRGLSSRIESIWLEEGTAQIAAELYGRQMYGRGSSMWKSNANYDATLYCELRPTWDKCLDRPIVMYDHFGWLSEYAAQTDVLSPIDPQESTIYGSAWFLMRWAADQFATNEATFFKALTQQSTDTGIVNLEARTGVPWAQLLGGWALAFAVEENVPSVVSRNHSIPSWNVPSIFGGMSTDLEGEISAAPLRRTIVNGGAFTSLRSVASGSMAIFAVAGYPVYAIGLTSRAGAPFSAGGPVRIAIWRYY